MDLKLNPLSKAAFCNGVRAEVEGEIRGSFTQMITLPIEKAVVIGVTTAHPDPRINHLCLPCDGCPYHRADDTCGPKCDSWYRYLLERKTYNELPFKKRQAAEMQFVRKEAEKKARARK